MPAFGSGQLFYGAPGAGSEGMGGLKSNTDLQLSGAGLMNDGQSSALLQNPAGIGSLGGVTSQSPAIVKDTSLSERKHNLDLLETSFKNILTKQD